MRWRLGGRGPAIALLHGWALDLEYWDPVAALLPDFTVLGFDRVGYGLSEGQPDIRRNVADLQALLDEAGIARATVLGMSQGARLAIHFALQHPQRTAALVLDGAPLLEGESELPLGQYRRLLEAGDLAAMRTQILQHPLMQLVGGNPAGRAVLGGCVGRYRGLDLRTPAGRRSPPDLASLDVATLVLNGARDTASRREAGRSLLAALPRAQRAELADAGHLAALDDPAGYARLLRAFISR